MRQITPLRIIDEASALPAVGAEGFVESTTGRGDPARLELIERGGPTSEASILGGAALGAWPFGPQPPPSRPTWLCLTRDVIHLPGFGAILTADGTVLKGSVREAIERWPDLVGLPGVRTEGEATTLGMPDATPFLERAEGLAA
jgi:capsular polysaccharide biosynthesis protein